MKKTKEADKKLKKYVEDDLSVPPLKRVTVEELKKHLIKCPKGEHYHFRHTGFLERGYAFTDPVAKVEVRSQSLAVKTCITCGTSIVLLDDFTVDVSDIVDVKNWDAFDKIANEKLGPSGNCE